MVKKAAASSGSGAKSTTPSTTLLDEPPSSQRRPSLINVILLYLTLIGLGGIGGYFAFNFLDGSRCETLLDNLERRHKGGGSRTIVTPPAGGSKDESIAKLQELQTAVQTRQLWQTVERYVCYTYLVRR